jgi:D-aminopeptidase
MIVLATDAPLSPHALRRLARRAPLALGRVGSYVGHGAGDFIIAFSTRNRVPYRTETTTYRPELLRDEALDPLFLAAVEAVEEAIYNSLTRATTTTGRGGRTTVEAIPVDRLRALFAASRSTYSTPPSSGDPP